MIWVKFLLNWDDIYIPNLPEAFTSDKNAENLEKEYLNQPFFIG